MTRVVETLGPVREPLFRPCPFNDGIHVIDENGFCKCGKAANVLADSMLADRKKLAVAS